MKDIQALDSAINLLQSTTESYPDMGSRLFFVLSQGSDQDYNNNFMKISSSNGYINLNFLSALQCIRDFCTKNERVQIRICNIAIRRGIEAAERRLNVKCIDYKSTE